MGNSRGGTLRQSQKVGIGVLLTGNTKWPLVVSYYTTGSNSRYLLVSFEDDRVARRKARATTSFSSLVVAKFPISDLEAFCLLEILLLQCCIIISSFSFLVFYYDFGLTDGLLLTFLLIHFLLIGQWPTTVMRQSTA